MVLHTCTQAESILVMVRKEAGGIVEIPLVRRGVDASESHACDFGGRRKCTITSLGRSEHGVVSTTRRSSSPRREAHRGKPRGSAVSAPFGSSASTTRYGVMSATACGEA